MCEVSVGEIAEREELNASGEVMWSSDNWRALFCPVGTLSGDNEGVESGGDPPLTPFPFVFALLDPSFSVATFFSSALQAICQYTP
jgi:hypothetical protein